MKIQRYSSARQLYKLDITALFCDPERTDVEIDSEVLALGRSRRIDILRRIARTQMLPENAERSYRIIWRYASGLCIHLGVYFGQDVVDYGIAHYAMRPFPKRKVTVTRVWLGQKVKRP